MTKKQAFLNAARKTCGHISSIANWMTDTTSAPAGTPPNALRTTKIKCAAKSVARLGVMAFGAIVLAKIPSYTMGATAVVLSAAIIGAVRNAYVAAKNKVVRGYIRGAAMGAASGMAVLFALNAGLIAHKKSVAKTYWQEKFFHHNSEDQNIRALEKNGACNYVSAPNDPSSMGRQQVVVVDKGDTNIRDWSKTTARKLKTTLEHESIINGKTQEVPYNIPVITHMIKTDNGTWVARYEVSPPSRSDSPNGNHTLRLPQNNR